MNSEEVIQRRNWFRYFPEGSIEFIAITRVLAIMLLVALLVVGGTQRPIVLLVLAVMLWIDYALTLWWTIQMGTDLRALSGEPERPPDQWRQHRLAAFLPALLPSLLILLLVAPWADFFLRGAQRALVLRILVPILIVCLPVAAVFGYRALQRIGLGGFWRTGAARAVGTLTLLIPIVHWLAIHRLLKHFQTTLHGDPEGGKPSRPFGEDLRPESTAAPGATPFVVADVFLILAVVSWALVIAASGGETTLPRLATVVGYIGGIGFGALFAVVDVAAMEKVQRQFIDVLRQA